MAKRYRSSRRIKRKRYTRKSRFGKAKAKFYRKRFASRVKRVIRNDLEPKFYPETEQNLTGLTYMLPMHYVSGTSFPIDAHLTNYIMQTLGDIS